MGLMRRVESRVERSVGAPPRESASEEARREHPRRNSKYFVQPAELARKLVREMEDHKVSHSAQEVVCGTYTVFLCPEDFDRLSPRRVEILEKLQRHLAKHVRARRYTVAGDVSVSMVMDQDLSLGRFGILAERNDPIRPPAAGVGERVPARSDDRAGGTKVIPAKEAAALGLSRQTIVVTMGNRVCEFSKGRVVVGRGRDADFRVDDPNASRRHAVIFWDGGQIVVQDLESTNGTMVNGYPVTSTVLRGTDVLVIGECRIKVEGR